jgi:hypothetical protein
LYRPGLPFRGLFRTLRDHRNVVLCRWLRLREFYYKALLGPLLSQLVRYDGLTQGDLLNGVFALFEGVLVVRGSHSGRKGRSEPSTFS